MEEEGLPPYENAGEESFVSQETQEELQVEKETAPQGQLVEPKKLGQYQEEPLDKKELQDRQERAFNRKGLASRELDDELDEDADAAPNLELSGQEQQSQVDGEFLGVLDNVKPNFGVEGTDQTVDITPADEANEAKDESSDKHPEAAVDGDELGDFNEQKEGTSLAEEQIVTNATSFLPPDCVKVIHMLGLDSRHRNNICFIEDDVILTSVGNSLIFIDLNSLEQKYIMGVDGGGIGAIAVHPLGKMYAVAEKCRTRAPNIYLYEYPSHKLLKVMRSGTERAYSALGFEKNGQMLASVGSFPDFLLTLWDWKEENIILRSKAFSQDVYTVHFSPYFDGQLTTSGMGHIRFWSMAATFTGLKLQGAIGKFGQVELSDVSAFLEFPDGKVLSGSETGELLLWDGGLIKAMLCRRGNKPCHDGSVEVVLHDRVSSCVLTGGADGFVRLWDFNQLNEAEPGEDSHNAVVRPLEEVFLGEGVRVKSLLWERRRWVVLDEAGRLLLVSLPGADAAPVPAGSLGKRVEVQSLMEFHSGAIVAARTAPDSHCVVTAGKDGSIRLTDYISQKQLCKYVFGSPVTSFTCSEPDVRLLFSGHADGVVRALTRCQRNEALALSAVTKPHKGPVVMLALSEDLSWLASCGKDETVFFFTVELTEGGCKLVPIAYARLPAVPTCGAWAPPSYDENGVQAPRRVLLGTTKGIVIEVTAPSPDVDTTRTFEVKCDTREYVLRLPKLTRRVPRAKTEALGAAPAATAAASDGASTDATKSSEVADVLDNDDEVDEEYDEEADPHQPFEIVSLTALPENNGDFLVTSTGKAAGQVWRCSFNSERASAVISSFAPGKAPQTDASDAATAGTPAGGEAGGAGTVTSFASTSLTTFVGFSPVHSVTPSTLALLGSSDGLVRVQPLGPLRRRKVRGEEVEVTTIVDPTTDRPQMFSLGAYLEVKATHAAKEVRERELMQEAYQSGMKKRKKNEEIQESITLPPYWEAPLHDMQQGRISGVAMSYDGKYLISAGRDGAIYVQKMSLPGMAPSGPSEATVMELASALPLAHSLSPPPEDIVSPTSYTLEEDKQQAELDQLRREAELKKLSVREQLEAIRKEFRELLAQNHARPEAARLPRSDFEIDPGLREMMEEQAQRREEVARLELAWETEKRRLALRKLKGFFLDELEVERIVLRALRGKLFVTTFRTAKLSAKVQKELQELRESQAAAATASAAAVGGAAAARALLESKTQKGKDGAPGVAGGAGGTAGALGGGLAAPGLSAAGGAGHPPENTSKMNKADLRRLARRQRQMEWAAFDATRPDDTYENPADVEAIEEAKRTVGDYKLKSDPNYVIPEEDRVTPARKRQQMLLLEEALYESKMDFNRRFLALREVKKKVISELAQKVGQLAEINSQLGTKEDEELAPVLAAARSVTQGPQPAGGLAPDEAPEVWRESVTEKELQEFALRREEEERKAARGGGLGGFASASASTVPPAGSAAAGKKGAGNTTGGGAGGASAAGTGAKTDAAGGGAGAGATGGSGLTTTEEALAKMMSAVPQSDLEKNLALYSRRRLEHLRSKIKGEVLSMVEAFDDALNALRTEKFQLEGDVKAGEMRLLHSYLELQLLREFEKREDLIMQKRQAKVDDKQDLMKKMRDCAEKLEARQAELAHLADRRVAVVAEFDAAVPETDPLREPLAKIFHKKIKRTKKRLNADGEEDSEEDSDDDDGDDDDEEEEDDDSEEVCPPGCDPALYDRVCELRERRLDEEDAITELNRTTEVLKKEKESLSKKQKLMEQALAAVNAEMTEFQKEKQAKLNTIEVIVPLRMHQIEYLVDNRMPLDLSGGLVFSKHELARLKRRIEELMAEKQALRARQKDLRRQHLTLVKEKAEKEARVAELEARAVDVQMLKFGQVIDLELLDRVGSSRGTEEIKEEIRRAELQYARELAKWDADIETRTDELMALTRENTACLNAVSDLTVAQRKLEGGLTSTRKGIFEDPVQQRRAEVEERDSLVATVNSQAKLIEKLKGQIIALRRKDTSVYG